MSAFDDEKSKEKIPATDEEKRRKMLKKQKQASQEKYWIEELEQDLDIDPRLLNKIKQRN